MNNLNKKQNMSTEIAINALKTALNIHESIDSRGASESEMVKLNGIQAAITIALENLEG